jgi:hypothetical protein
VPDEDDRKGKLGRQIEVEIRDTARRNVRVRCEVYRSSADPRDHPDCYLALEGLTRPAGSSRGEHAPLCVAQAYVFESRPLLAALAARGMDAHLQGRSINPGRAAWRAAMVYPEAHYPRLTLSDAQRDALRLFAPLAAD